MAISTTVTDNCRLMTEYIPTVNTAAIGIWLQNGARYEKSSQTGYAHFLEHLLFKGTDRYSSKELSTRFEVMGGHINAETGRELTAFHGVVPKQYGTDLLALLLDMVTHTQFSDTDFLLERDVVLQELAMLKDDPEEALEDFSTEQVWGQHSMGKQILGTVDSLKQADRSSFTQYMRHVVSAHKLCIVAVGNVDQASLESLCRDIDLVIAEPLAIPAPEYKPLQAQLDNDAEQKHLLWLMPAVGYHHPQQATYEIANHMLAGGYDSRLYQVLREQLGLVYSIHSRNDHYSDTGLWFVQTNTDMENTDKTIQAVENTIKQLIDEGPSQQELDFTRQHLQSALILESDDLDSKMDTIAQDIIYTGRIISLEEQLDGYSQVTTNDIQDVISRAWNQVSFFSTS